MCAHHVYHFGDLFLHLQVEGEQKAHRVVDFRAAMDQRKRNREVLAHSSMPVAQARSSMPVVQARSSMPVVQARGSTPVAQARSSTPVAQARSSTPVAQTLSDTPSIPCIPLVVQGV